MSAQVSRPLGPSRGTCHTVAGSSFTTVLSPAVQHTASPRDRPWSCAHSHHSQAGSPGGKDWTPRQPLLGRVSAWNIPQVSFSWPSDSHFENTERRWEQHVYKMACSQGLCNVWVHPAYGSDMQDGLVIFALCLKVCFLENKVTSSRLEAQDNDSSSLNSHWALCRVRPGTQLMLSKCFLIMVLPWFS